MPKKKLTYILHDIAVGGVEVALLSAIPQLNRQYILRIIVLGKINQKMIQEFSPEEKHVFHALDYPLALYPIFVPRMISKVLENDPDIVISSLWRGALVGSLAKILRKKIRYYAFVHNTGFPHFLAKEFNRRATRVADVVLTDSIATRHFVEREFRPGAKIKVVSFLTRPTPVWQEREIPEAGKEVRFMFLGRITPVKNLPASIELIKYLRSKSIAATLDIYGTGHESIVQSLQELINLAGLEQHVRFKGEVRGEDKWALFSLYHFYLQLSFNEGMAMSVSEAMQHGVVCVVSPVGEIVNYAADMESAVFIETEPGESAYKDFEKVPRVIEDPSLFIKLAKNGQARFASQKVYTESLIEHIESPD